MSGPSAADSSYVCRVRDNSVYAIIEVQTYMAIIACLLILIHTGRAPTKRTFEMICLYMSGWASLDELERHIEKLRAAKKQGTRATLRAGVFAADEIAIVPRDRKRDTVQLGFLMRRRFWRVWHMWI